MPNTENRILFFNRGTEYANEVSQIIQSMKLDIPVVLASSLEDVLSLTQAFNIIITLSGQDAKESIDCIRKLIAKYPDAPLIYLAEKNQVAVARVCLQIQNAYFLRADDAVLIPDVIQRILVKQVQTQERIDYLKQQQDAIVKLATNPSLKEGNWHDALREISRVTAETLGVNRVSIWFYQDDENSIRCDMLYNADKQSSEQGMELSADSYPGYFKALHENRVIVAVDAHTDSATCEFSDNYLDAYNIVSLLDAPIRIQGQMLGVICNEQLDTIRQWTYDDQQFVGAMADLVALTVENRERRRAEEALRKREGYLKEAESIAHLGNFEANLIDQSVSWSDEAYRIFGRENQSGITWEKYQSFLNPTDYDRVMASVDRAAQHGESYAIEHGITLEDGTRKHLFAIGRPIKDEAGNIVKIFGIVQDITARKQAEKQDIELRLNQQKVSFLQDFIMTMTHDLKTPVSVIKSTIYLLRRSHEKDKRENHLSQLDRQTTQMQKMIDDILLVSYLEYLPELQFHRTNLNDIIHEIVNQLREKVIKKDIQLTLQLSPAPLEIDVARKEIIRAFLNLLENAINYTPEKGQVFIKTYHEGTQVFCEIIDSGIGIGASDISNIFNQFYRADNARSFGDGTGLGLAIVKKTIELHQGTITATSKPGDGTHMIVVLKQTGS